MTATSRHIEISLFSYQQQLESKLNCRSDWQDKCFYIARGHCTLVDQYELERDRRSDVTSNVTGNDASVKVYDTLDDAQSATVAVEAEAMYAGSSPFRDCRSRDDRRTLR